MDDAKPKKHKREKSESSKKRTRQDDPDGQSGEPRKHKKSKKHDHSQPNGDQAVQELPEETGKSHKKQKKAKVPVDQEPSPDLVRDDTTEKPLEKSKGEKTKKKHKRKKHVDEEEDVNPSVPDATQAQTQSEVEDGATEGELAQLKKEKREKRKAKKEKKSRKKEAAHQSEAQDAQDAQETAPKSDEAHERKRKHKDRKKRKQDKQPSPVPNDGSDPVEDDAVDAMDVDSPKATTALSSGVLDDPDSPFCTQTVSLYIPFFPSGFDKPITKAASQHLDPLLNNYSALLRGVLLGYRNVNLSERPIRADPKNPPDDHTGAILASIDEYAVGFGWLTADLDLFIPRRGAPMEGIVNLQSEGHIGVVCWDKFNASIEAKRLPRGWRWIDLTMKPRGKAKNTTTPLSPESDSGEKGDALQSARAKVGNEEGQQGGQEEEEEEEEDMLDGQELEMGQMHTTGYWVNGDNKRVSGALRLRIKNFDIGLAGDFGYLSIEGTMLEPEEERRLAAEERQTEKKLRAMRNPSGLLRPISKRVPEFSMTRFGKEDEEEDSGQRVELYKGSRPGSPG